MTFESLASILPIPLGLPKSSSSAVFRLRLSSGEEAVLSLLSRLGDAVIAKGSVPMNDCEATGLMDRVVSTVIALWGECGEGATRHANAEACTTGLGR